ncbi:hypothetical protein TorRG33x02_340670 [Trema orientale]|uniref:Uncharacterized protein n=1 Tax=Trema orientale TaxID=63057 RepID=A0A2P5AUT3_TREOI|nr:hypothetical protein TorRG33x02_340670 [Trema orientale]
MPQKKDPYLQEESSAFEENTAIEIQMVEADGDSQSQRKFDREKRKGAMKYRGNFSDILSDHCYYLEEYFNDILEEMLATCEVDQYQAHQALLTPAPSVEEWRAQRSLTMDGLRKSLSHKRKAQPFILLIVHPSDMP